MAFQRQLFQTTVPSSPRQSSVLLRIGGTSAMSPAVPTIRKAMVLRSERWRPSKRSSDRKTSSLPFCPTAQPSFPTSELALLSWLWEESSEPPCHHCHRRSSHESLVTRKCESVTQSWSGVRRKTTIVATATQATQFSSKRMEKRAGSCRERWWGNALHVHSWYRHQEVTCVGTADIWNRSLHLRAVQMTSVTRSQEQSSLQTTRWDRSLTQLRLLTSSPVYTWLGSPGHHWQADHHHHRRLQGTLHFHRRNLHTSLLQCRHSLQCLQPHPFAPDMAASSISLPDIGDFVCSVVPWEHTCVVFHCAPRAQVCSFPLCHESTFV